ncbi:19847_t:CDS:2, partial [Gigaspora rosea]
ANFGLSFVDVAVIYGVGAFALSLAGVVTMTGWLPIFGLMLFHSLVSDSCAVANSLSLFIVLAFW